jgi:hypothetical protein
VRAKKNDRHKFMGVDRGKIVPKKTIAATVSSLLITGLIAVLAFALPSNAVKLPQLGLAAPWSSSDLRPRNKMAKKRRTRFSLKEDRQLIQMAAATKATLEEAAAIFRTSVDTIEKKSKKLGIQLRRRVEKGPSAGL